MELEIINPIDYQKWDEILIDNNCHTFFYSSSWAKVLVEAYKYKPIYFILIDKGKLLALIPVMEIKSFLTGARGVSLPFSDFCEPFISEDIQFQDVLEFVLKYGERAGWDYFELRGGVNCGQTIPYSEYYYMHTLSLTENIEQLFSALKSNTRRNIKKAIREGVEIKICNSSESIDEFYKLNCMTRKSHGLPPQPFYFFIKIFDHIISKQHGFVVLASYMKRTIAGAIFFHFGNTAIYKYGASNKSYQYLRANNLVMWEAIKWYSQNGYTSLYFGRTEPENMGLLQFKDGWGTKKQKRAYFKYNLEKKTVIRKRSIDFDFYHKIFEKLPTSFSKIIGTLLYKHMG